MEAGAHRMQEMVTTQDASLVRLQALAGQAHDYASEAKASNTKRAYTSDWQHFSAWCEEHSLRALPAAPETASLYLSDLAATQRVSTLQRRLAAISQAHQLVGEETPTRSLQVRLVMQRIRRSVGVAANQKAPATVEVVRQMVEGLGPGGQGLRDRALLLVGFAGAFRRSELVGLDVEDVTFAGDGLVILLCRSKSDQEGEDHKKGLPYGSNPATCPVCALRAWLESASIIERPVFRAVDRYGNVKASRLSTRAVALIVKRCAEAAGLDPDIFAGHSRRAGLATSAAAAGVSERVIMQQTGHRSVQMVRRYIHEGSLFRENAAAKVGL
jgi:site-specific recombinase XerD